MAFVKDKAESGPLVAGVDRQYTAPNRKVTSAPAGSLTPGYVGEIVQYNNAGTSTLWKAFDATTSGWVQITPGLAV